MVLLTCDRCYSNIVIVNCAIILPDEGRQENEKFMEREGLDAAGRGEISASLGDLNGFTGYGNSAVGMLDDPQNLEAGAHRLEFRISEIDIDGNPLAGG